MRTRQRFLFLAPAVVLVAAAAASASPIRVSTRSTSHVGTNGLVTTAGSVAEVATSTGAATIAFNESSFAQSENLDGFQALPNGHVLLSTSANATIGSPALAFKDGDIVDYDPATHAATLFFSESNFTSNVDVDAFFLRPNGHLLLSTDATATLAGLTFKDGDLVDWDPVSHVATLFFSESHFGADENIDAVALLPNGHIALSVERDTGATLGGIGFTDGDIVDYDPVHDTATILRSEASMFAENVDVDAIDIGCGNGFTEADEGCDGAGESASCNANCTVADCGDGIVNVSAGEQCDDAGESATCDANCTVASCGDGTLNTHAGEQCDTAGESATCDADCTPVVCGDGTLNTHAGEQCDDAGESATCDDDCTVAACGDGTLNVTAGETCDDGNTVNGDCCAAGCAFEPLGSACPADDDLCTTVDQCDGAGACEHLAEPEPSCLAPTLAGKALVRLTDNPIDTKDALLWKWGAGAATTVADLGDPTTAGGATYKLCLYDAHGIVGTAEAPAGGTCGSKPCWKATKKGYTYVDKDLTPDGLQKLVLQAGADGAAKIVIKGKGAFLDLPAMPMASPGDLPLTVQLRNSDGGCWGATYSALRTNVANQLKAKSD